VSAILPADAELQWFLRPLRSSIPELATRSALTPFTLSLATAL